MSENLHKTEFTSSHSTVVGIEPRLFYILDKFLPLAPSVTILRIIRTGFNMNSEMEF